MATCGVASSQPPRALLGVGVEHVQTDVPTHWAVDVFFFANVFTMQHLPCIHVRAHLEGISDRYAKLRYPILTPCAAAARHVPSDATPGTGITTKRDHAHARTVAALGHSGPKTRG